MDYNKFYNTLNDLYKICPEVNKLIEYNFNTFPETIIKYSPLSKLNKLVEKNIKNKSNKKTFISSNNNKRLKLNDDNKTIILEKNIIDKLNKEIDKTNKWIQFSDENYKRTELNKNFKNYCIDTKLEPNIVNQELISNNINISKKQLKKQTFIYNKMLKTKDNKQFETNMELD